MNKEMALEIVREELACANQGFGCFASSHEGYAIIKEELDELWEAIKDKELGASAQEIEARQVAAMAIRFLIDLC